MNKYLLIPVVIAGLQSCAANAPELSEAQQASLDAALAGRTAEPAVSCVNQRNIRGNKGFGEGVILFTTNSRKLVYVNRPPAGCPELNSMRAMRTVSTTNQLCRGDLVTIFDPGSSIEYGSCGLGDFVPYRRP
jgi:hypothetical protein